MKVLHLLHLVIARAVNRFQLATVDPMAPSELMTRLVVRGGELDAKARRLFA